MLLRHYLLCSLVVLAMYPVDSFSWAENGHRVVAKIAEERLSPVARAEVRKILGKDSMPSVSNWMDFIKSDPDKDAMSNYHYVEIQEGQDYWSSKKNPKGDIIRAIVMYEDTLRKKTSTKEDRMVALKALIHLIGDVHQPLHVGKGKDMGGLLVGVKWFNEKTNLHKLWDEDLIEFQKLSYTEYASFIDHPSSTDARIWQSSGLLDWVYESVGYRGQIYSGLRDEKGRKKYNLSYRYNFDNIGLVNQRLQQAGIRLAFFLNSIFEGKENVGGRDLRSRLAGFDLNE